jgi:hypothetical protein
MEFSVVLLVVALALVGTTAILVPLRQFAARGLRSPGARRALVFFAGTGIGYLAIEIALLQRFGLLLGHPNHALSIVLAFLLLATGLGALNSARIVGALGGLRFVVYLLALAMLVEYALVFPRLLSWVALPFSARVAIVLALVGPIGLLLGSFVPVALDDLKRTAPELVPWAWGVNGIASVLAPVLGAAFSMTWGIGALFLAAIPVYLVVGFVSPAATTDPAAVPA